MWLQWLISAEHRSVSLMQQWASGLSGCWRVISTCDNSKWSRASKAKGRQRWKSEYHNVAVLVESYIQLRVRIEDLRPQYVRKQEETSNIYHSCSSTLFHTSAVMWTLASCFFLFQRKIGFEDTTKRIFEVRWFVIFFYFLVHVVEVWVNGH